ncbi:SDR family oxidoreductase [Streptomyces sp. WMMC500]|uniref:SDR family NAD(P)-dependent oxidoreductase n=1 Tax=Streptomyces sp. WMMC500 TaxID=3015154 RepID=UPI00248CD568|nr:SDR family NAD(P)-dependent oxidoreductase [Streptomyces sp. WMMC500]WBB63146.1 SDR family oxidoreductase [Streptomyces sp. WMMC500]
MTAPETEAVRPAEDRPTSGRPTSDRPADRPASRRALLRTGTAGLAAGLAAGAVTTGTARAASPAADGGRAAADDEFDGKVVLVTGATSGMGAAAARALAGRGARVFFCGRRARLGREVEAEIRGAGGEATYMRADVRHEDQVRAFVRGCVRRYGRIDVAYNNAGVESPRAARLHEQTLADVEDVWRTNAAGTFLCMKYEIPQMLAQGGGVVVNTASISAEVGFATIAPYNASKHAVASLTKVAALEYAAEGVRVTAFAPGAVDTPMLRRAAEAFGVTYEEIARDYPIRRIVRAEEMAAVMMWLGSSAAAPVVGTDVDASGGWLTG